MVVPSRILDSQLATMDPRFAALLDEVVPALGLADCVEVIVVVGSTAEGIADKYSDLDLQCGIRGDIASAAPAVRDAVFSVIEVGDYRWTAPNRILSMVATNWLRLDVTIISLDDPRGGFAHNAIELLNHSDEPLLRGSVPILQPDPAALTAQVTRFLRSLGLVVRDLHRGDLRLCCFAVEFLVDELVTLMYQAQGLKRGAQKGAYDQLPDHDVHVLQSLPVAEPEERSIIEGHVAVADEYLALAHALCQQWGARWPTEMEQGTRVFLRAELGVELRAV